MQCRRIFDRQIVMAIAVSLWLQIASIAMCQDDQADGQVEAAPESISVEQYERAGLTIVPLGEKKEPYSQKYYDAWIQDVKNIERILVDPATSTRTKTMQSFNRFLDHLKIVPDDSKRILAVFMDAYRDDKHRFCADYANTIPGLLVGNYTYWSEYYRYELPVMDEFVQVVLNSYDKELRGRLERIRESDQSLRATINESTSPNEVKQILEAQRKIDVENLKEIEQIISTYGYPGCSLVGVEQEKTAFLVIQHSGHTAIEKHLPAIEKAIRRKDLEPNVYPYLFDRLEVAQGRPQHFGTQRKLETNELFPVHDSDNLNQRRHKYGLLPISKGK